MRLHESIVWSVDEEDLSGLNIFCDSSKREEIAEFFEENFNKYWDDAKDSVEEKYGSCQEKDDDCPSIATVSIADYGVKVSLEPLYLSYQYGDYIESEGYAQKALDKTLKKLLNQYPDVSYEGYIAYNWSDVHGGEAEQWELSSKGDLAKDRVFDFIGESLAVATSDDEFWESMQENLEDAEIDDFKEILLNFKAYKKWLPEDVVERLLTIAEEIDEDLRSELDEVVEAIENGEEVEIEEDEIDESSLPEGYMDVLNAVVSAEKAKKEAEIDDELASEDDEDDEDDEE